MTDPLRLVDTQLLRSFRAEQPLDINQLIDTLGVTATAIRQRLQRLLAAGLIQRQKVILGRGRPMFEYRLTAEGRRYAGADPSALAEAMWQEILGLADGESRRRVLSGVAKRLGRSYAECISADAGDTDDSLAKKMHRLSEVLAAQQVTTHSDDSAAGLPLLNICSCPYPTLRDATEERSMCQLEAEIFSEALGLPVHLSHCVLDGDTSCHFVPTVSDESVAAVV